MSCGVGLRHSSDPSLLWLWRRPVATVPIRPLAWEPLYAAGAALGKAKRQKQTNKNNNKSVSQSEYFVADNRNCEKCKGEKKKRSSLKRCKELTGRLESEVGKMCNLGRPGSRHDS